ncbi:MAG: hypothetical protein HY800_01020 [Ignavibacteriales bacterium]|nr:hypothetical protein [Ignavibacteriales bacterium]
MEKRSEIVFGKNPLRHFDAWLYDRFVHHFVDGVFPISDFLASNIKRFAPQKPYFKVPILVDFSRYRDVPKERNEKYILFCGGLAYLNVIQFILNSFEHCVSDNIFLYLVVNGPSVLLSDLKNSISKLSKRQFVRVFSRLSDAELSKLYI